MIKLETKRLIIRNFEKEDINDLFDFASDPSVALKAGFALHKNIDMSREVLENDLIPNSNIFAVELKNEHKVIGKIEIRNVHKKSRFEDLNLSNNSHELAFSLNSKYWNKGYMTEAVNKVIEYAFNVLNSDGIYATTSSKNYASQKLQIKVGLNYIDSIPRDKKWIDGSQNNTQRRGVTKKEYLNKSSV